MGRGCLESPPGRHALLLLGTHVLHPIYLFFREFLQISPTKIPVPVLHAYLFLLSCLELEFSMSRLSSPSPVLCPVLLKLLLIFFSLALSHTPPPPLYPVPS